MSGVILGFTGPIESITPGMADSAELAFTEVNESGLLLDGATLRCRFRADSTCIRQRRRAGRRRGA